MKVLIDTNVALDFMSSREPFASNAEKVFLLCCSELVDAYIAANSFCDLHYVLHKCLHDEGQTRSAMTFWLDIVKVAQTTEGDCRNALDSEITDYEDAVIESIARRLGCEYIVTRNLGDFSKSSVPAVSPETLIQKFILFNSILKNVEETVSATTSAITNEYHTASRPKK